MTIYGGGTTPLLLRSPIVVLTRYRSYQVVFGPAATLWFRFLATKVRLKNKNAEILARVVVDQTVFSPAHLFMFLSTMSLMEGKDPKQKLRRSYWPTMITNWSVWPVVQAVNFKFVPLEHRVLLVNVVALGQYGKGRRHRGYCLWLTELIGWNCYLSHVNSH
jgi:protein Mpv17